MTKKINAVFSALLVFTLLFTGCGSKQADLNESVIVAEVNDDKLTQAEKTDSIVLKESNDTASKVSSENTDTKEQYTSSVESHKQSDIDKKEKANSSVSKKTESFVSVGNSSKTSEKHENITSEKTYEVGSSFSSKGTEVSDSGNSRTESKSEKDYRLTESKNENSSNIETNITVNEKQDTDINSNANTAADTSSVQLQHDTTSSETSSSYDNEESDVDIRETYSGIVICADCVNSTTHGEQPPEHTVECCLMESCIASGFGIAVKESGSWVFYKFDDYGHTLALDYLRKTTRTERLYVTVTGTYDGKYLYVDSFEEAPQI